MQTMESLGITFAVDNVIPATKLLSECRTHEAVKRRLRSEIESCCDYHGLVISEAHCHPLLAAVHTAFSEHRPLVLTPDSIWISIAQGIAHHMTIHGEALRSRFVSHQGKLNLVFQCRGWVEGSPENPWQEAFESWSNQIQNHVGSGIYDTLISDFSTTGLVERAVSQIVMMDVFERYFHYVCYGVCGIPAVTLEGTPDDWQRLADKVSALSVFDIDWWLSQLKPICEQFARASRGDIDIDHWQAICKLRSAYGGDIINGWIAKLFPYLPAFADGPCNVRNPIFETGDGISTLDTPPGLSRVPFTWINGVTGRSQKMEAIGGFVGVSQNAETLALKPKIGWAVRQADAMDVLLARLEAEHVVYPRRSIEDVKYLPSDFGKFYHHTSGADLFGNEEAAKCRIVSWDKIDPLDSNENPETLGSYGPHGRIWHRFAWRPDESWFAINLDINKMSPLWRDERICQKYDLLRDRFAPICRGKGETLGPAGDNPVIALSFTEFLEKILESGGSLDCFTEKYGDADYFTRRD